jgi:hypothetical protein
MRHTPPQSEGLIEDAIGLIGGALGWSPQSQQAAIEREKTKQLQLQVEAERLKGQRGLGGPGPLGVPWIAWGGAALLLGVYLVRERRT